MEGIRIKYIDDSLLNEEWNLKMILLRCKLIQWRYALSAVLSGINDGCCAPVHGVLWGVFAEKAPFFLPAQIKSPSK